MVDCLLTILVNQICRLFSIPQTPDSIITLLSFSDPLLNQVLYVPSIPCCTFFCPFCISIFNWKYTLAHCLIYGVHYTLTNRDKKTLTDFLYSQIPTYNMHEKDGPLTSSQVNEIIPHATSYSTVNGCNIEIDSDH